MKITELNIKSFRKLRDVKINLSNYNCLIGANEVGKTTTLDALFLLLTGETITYGKQIGDNSDKKNPKEAFEIEMKVETDKTSFDEEGNLVPVVKTYGIYYKDVYLINKDTQEEYYSRTDNKYFINGVSKNKGAYFEEIRDLFGIKQNLDKTFKDINFIRLLIDPFNLANLENKTLNLLIRSMVNVPSHEEIIMQNEKFKPIAMKLSENNFDFESTIKQINNENERLSGMKETSENEIAYQERLKEELNYDDNVSKELNEKHSTLIKQLENEQKELSEAIKVDEENDKAKKDKIKDLEEKINQKLSEVNSLADKGRAKTKLKDEASANLSIHKGTLFDINNNINAINININSFNNFIKSLEENFIDVECPKCKEHFTVEKEKDINERIKEYKQKIKSFQLEKNELEEKSKKYSSVIEEKQKELDSITKEYDTLVEKYTNARNEYEELKVELETIKNTTNNSDSTLKLQEKVNNTREQLNSVESLLKVEENKRFKLQQIEQEIERLNEQIVEINKKSYKLDVSKNLVKEYKILVSKITQEKTSEIFGDIQVSLVKESKDSSKEKSKCFIGSGDVSFNGLNTANKHVLGVKLIKKIREVLGGKDLPIIFDIIDNVDELRLANILDQAGTTQVLFTFATFNKDEKLNIFATDKKEDMINFLKNK